MARPSFYDDNMKYDYTQYWVGRDYENAAEEHAIASLLGKFKAKTAADIGGGYGRLCIFLQRFAKKVTLVEPSKKQLQLAHDFLNGSKVEISDGSSDSTGLKDGSVDLITMIRVMHHLPNPEKTFAEIARILSDDGVFILEFANSKNAKTRVRRGLKGRRTPHDPVDIRTDSTTDVDLDSPFVNHNPAKITEQLSAAGFEVVKKKSVSNFRSPTLKKLLPPNVLLTMEKITQTALSPLDFGPSIFLLVRKRS